MTDQARQVLRLMADGHTLDEAGAFIVAWASSNIFNKWIGETCRCWYTTGYERRVSESEEDRIYSFVRLRYVG